jgi:hypothetical protein
LTGVHRVQAVDNGLAYNKIRDIPLEDLLASTKPVDPPQTVNILAMAAPKLGDRREEWDLNTFRDIANTLMAGFTLVKEQNSGPVVIHSGKIGCGAFRNDPGAVYLLHCLVAQHMGVHVRLHGYSPEETARYRKDWEWISPGLQGLPLEDCINLLSRSMSISRIDE